MPSAGAESFSSFEIRDSMHVPDLKICAGCGSDVPEWDMRRKRVGEGDTLQNQKRVSCAPSQTCPQC